MTCDICSALAVIPGCGYCREEARDAALRRFRRAMRRHEKRARGMRFTGVANWIRECRVDYSDPGPAEKWLRDLAAECRAMSASLDLKHCRSRVVWRSAAFLYSLAADTVARLRVALAEAT